MVNRLYALKFLVPNGNYGQFILAKISLLVLTIGMEKVIIIVPKRIFQRCSVMQVLPQPIQRF